MLGGYSAWNDVSSPDHDCHKKALEMKAAIEEKLETKF